MIPPKLKYGDTIGVIAPASPEEQIVIDKKLLILKDLGFNIKEGSHLKSKLDYLAGTDIERAKDLMDMFLDNDVNAIMCFRGGYGTMRMLPFIDFSIIQNHPKIFIGYSDITTLLNNLYQKSNLVTFHGPMANSNLKDSITLNSLFNAIKDGYKPYSITQCQNEPIKYKNFNNIVTGTLVGGNLSLICSTLKTPYEIHTKNKILFIEEINELPYKIDRMFTQLILANKLSECKAIILGQFSNCTLPNYDSKYVMEKIIEDIILPLNIPTCYHIMSGHDMPNLTLPIGAEIKIDSNNMDISTIDKIVY